MRRPSRRKIMFVRGILATAVGIMLVTPAAFAGPAQSAASRHAGVNAREHRQTERIRHGVKDGDISRAEADRLRADEAAIRAEERVYRRSGDGLSRREAKDLQKDLNQT